MEEMITNELTGKTKDPKRDFYYSPAKTVSFSIDQDANHLLSALNYITTNIGMKKDLIKLPGLEKNGAFVVPISARLDSRGLKVEGYVETTEGFKLRFHYFKEGNIDIVHRSLENLVDPVEYPNAAQIDSSESVIIKPQPGEFIDPEFARQVIVRGSFIQIHNPKDPSKPFSHVVKTVHPGGIEVNSPKFNIQRFDKITLIKTEKNEFEDLEFTDAVEAKFNALKNYDALLPGKGYFYVQNNDIIVYNYKGKTRINRVVNVSGDNVYIIMVNAKGDHFITPISASEIKTIYKSTEEVNLSADVRIATFDNIIEKDTSISKTNHSFFTNYELAKKGDYTIIKDNSENSGIYQIVDKEDGVLVKIILSENKYVLTKEFIKINKDSFSKLNRFVPTRDISSNYAVDLIDMNSREVFIKKPTGDFGEWVYFINKKDDLKDLVFLKSGALNKGLSGDKFHYYNADGSFKNNPGDQYKDVTDEVKKLLGQQRGEQAEGLFVKKTGTYSWRHTNHLYRVSEFSKFTEDQKDKVLQ